MPGLKIVDNHFRNDSTGITSDAVKRPQLLSKASTVSVYSNPTTAITQPTIDEHTVLDNREGRQASNRTSVTISNRSSRAHSIESELAEFMNQTYIEQESSSNHNATPKIDIEEVLELEPAAEITVGPSRDEVAAMSEEDQVADFLSREKHFLILSAAGKPIYSRYGSGQVISGYMGILQAIMGFYQDSTTPDTLQAFSSPGLQVAMLVKGPESENTLRAQLDFLYQVVVSGITSTSMARLFDRGDNFDLGRLLSGSESFLDNISDSLTSSDLYFDMFFGCLSVFKFRATLRSKLEHIIAAHRPPSANLLYAMLAIDKKLVSILRPKGHTMHPTDLQLVFETVWERGFEEGQDYWLPLCLPKFNNTGFLHVFVSFLAPSIAIILISADKDDFFQLQTMKQDILQKMEKEGLVRDLIRARFSQITTASIGIADIVDHFVFKSRAKLQYLMPAPIKSKQQAKNSPLSRLRVRQIYEDLQGIGTRQKLQIRHYPTGEPGTEILALSWVTQSFECYVIGRPTSTDTNPSETSVSPTAALIGASNAIHQYVRREEGRVWLNDGITF
ncbi:protein of unknown function [Taphrina deformans PYCC 5710]|uniref:Vacuolar fusion protein MON1 n=1 Tax=Taphrina deformans (strain PYCC 5710 / ATCC 11124 / CBS 356.35 / IMI 108563 / JCM 9778 / NBRC 8474) TaxID=1097556 RepID=R4XCT3_TAPDE|nr:protein of unknown function [Taphrina deformans PYCC 5710]|eukprot:CCG83670.1 protein of unknown function [Taphrina deformans PYCC 5710]